MPNSNPSQNVRGYEVVSWSDVAEQVRAINPGLANAIDDIDPPASWKIVKARYAFGDQVLRKGELFIAHNGKLVGIEDPDFNPELRNLLNYTSMPIGVITHSTMELFADYQDQIIPFTFMLTGRIFALWTALDVNSPFHGKIWNIAAGCRSLFFLPKITDTIALKRVGKEFGAHFQIPRSLWEQWKLLREIATFESEPWYLENIYFSEEWFKDGPKQRQLRFFLLTNAWRLSSFLRNDIFFYIIFSYAQAEKNIKIDPYLADTIKHLYRLGAGSYSGFVLADSDISAPIHFIQKVFNEIYDLEYAPTLMHTSYLRPEIQKNLFYSLQLPTLLEFAPKAREKATNLEGLYYIQSSIRKLKAFILSERQDMKGQEMYQWAENVAYNYYHSHSSEELTIRSISELVAEEPILQKELLLYKKPFCETNGFMRGLIKLSLT